MDHEPAFSTDLALQTAVPRRVRLPAIPASAGDHASIFYFLQTVFQGPTQAEFDASLDDPFYEPRDRLLLYRRRSLVAHAHLTHRSLHLDATPIPAAGLHWFGVAAEHRGLGLGMHLLRAAESCMMGDGAVVGLLRTSIPRFFHRAGWTPLRQSSCRSADVRSLLACLLEQHWIPRRRRRLHIRPWLQWERDSLARIYQENIWQHDSAIGGHFVSGPLERTGAYWKWLLNRRGYDQVYVALEGPDQLEIGETTTRLVGYAVTRGDHIIELMTSPDHPRAAAELLFRCCGDAIEHDRQSIVLHAPPTCPWFELFDAAGGGDPRPTSENGTVPMLRLLDPLELLRRLGKTFERRIIENGLSYPFDLGLLVDGEKYRIEAGAHGVSVSADRVGRSYLRMNGHDFTQLFLGQLDWDSVTLAGRLECSTMLAREMGRALFPQLPFWRPPWDEMPAKA